MGFKGATKVRGLDVCPKLSRKAKAWVLHIWVPGGGRPAIYGTGPVFRAQDGQGQIAVLLKTKAKSQS